MLNIKANLNVQVFGFRSMTIYIDFVTRSSMVRYFTSSDCMQRIAIQLKLCSSWHYL